MTDEERISFSPITKRKTIVRPHSPYSEATGPMLKEGKVAARIQALHNAQILNSHAPPNPGSSSRVQLRSNKVASLTIGGIAKGVDNRSGYGRRKSLSFAPPASRNASVTGQYLVPPSRYTPPSSVLSGSGAGTRVERVGNRFIVVGAKTVSQHDVLSPWAVLRPKQAGPEETDGLSPGTKSVGEHGSAVSNSINSDEASTEHQEVLKRGSIADELGAMIDKAIDDHNTSQTEWSEDSSSPEIHDHHGIALSEHGSSTGSSTPLNSPVRSHTNRDDQSVAATKYSSTSSGSDQSKRHRHHRKHEYHRRSSNTADTIFPKSSSDTAEYPTEESSSPNGTAKSDTTAHRHFSKQNAGHPMRPSSSLPASISRRSPRTYRHRHRCHYHHRSPHQVKTPAPTVIVHKTNQAEEISRPRLVRRHETSSLTEDYHHHHGHSHQPLPHHHHTSFPHRTPSHRHHPPCQTPLPTPNPHSASPPPSNNVPTQLPAPPTTPPPAAPPAPAPVPPAPTPTPSTTTPSPSRPHLPPTTLRQHSLPTLAPPLLSPPLATASILKPRHLSASSAYAASASPRKKSWWRFVFVDEADGVGVGREGRVGRRDEAKGGENRYLRLRGLGVGVGVGVGVRVGAGHTLQDCGHEHEHDHVVDAIERERDRRDGHRGGRGRARARDESIELAPLPPAPAPEPGVALGKDQVALEPAYDETRPASETVISSELNADADASASASASASMTDTGTATGEEHGARRGGKEGRKGGNESWKGESEDGKGSAGGIRGVKVVISLDGGVGGGEGEGGELVVEARVRGTSRGGRW